MSRALIWGLLLVTAVALALRCPQLDRRPLHGDEAVHAIKFGGLWEDGSYKYDPNEYHGPSLYYFTWGWAKLTGAPALAEFDGARLRMVTVVFGVGLIFLLPLIADGLGRGGTICAGALTALSPAMVFYSRYFIHEIPLVFFTLLALAAGWRYYKSRRLGWALLAGAAVGLMQATKETFVFSLAAAGIALALTFVWNRRVKPEGEDVVFALNFKHLAAGLGAWLAVAGVFFSSFFTNAAGVLDAVRTYGPWIHRAGGASPHMHAWYYYLARLAFFHPARGPIWSEGLILALALAGLIAVFTGKGLRGGSPKFLRFVAFYTLALTAIYCAIGYKTPWCLVNFLEGMILLAGMGAVALIEWMPRRGLKVAMALLILAGAGQLGAQAWAAGVTYCADRRNPYVYAHTSPDLMNLVAKVDALAKVDPAGREMVLKVMAAESDYWPLPWYFRSFKQVGWWNEVPADPYAPVMVVSSKLQAGLDEKKTHVMIGLFELRPETFLELYVRLDLWRSYLEKNPPASDGD